MTDKQLFKLALDALEANYLLVNGTETHGGLEQCLDGYYSSCFDTDPINKQTEEAITALKGRLADPMREVQRLGQEIEQEPVAWWNNTCTHIDLNVSGRGTPLYTHPPQRVEQKTVMWPCLIDTADFSKGTITVVMQCEDYKVSAGTHWLSTTPPQRTEPTCPECKAVVLYECVACSSNNYPPKETT